MKFTKTTKTAANVRNYYDNTSGPGPAEYKMLAA